MLIVLLLYLCGNGYLFWKVWIAMSGLPVWGKTLITLLFWILVFSLFVSIVFRETSLPDIVSKVMFHGGATWLVFLLYMILSLIVLDVARLFIPLDNTLWYALSITGIIMIYGYINYKQPRVERFDIKLEKEFQGKRLKIVAVSDIHIGYGTGISALKEYVEMINGQKPDVVLISGDLIDNSVKPLKKEPFDKVLSELKAPMGVYMVPGNHEYISGIDACMDFLRDTPVTLLRDSVVELPGGVQIVGRDDRSNRNRKSLAKILEMVDKNKPVIVMDHQPYRLAEVDSLEVDLQLSGHTHHGQVWPLSKVTDFMYEQSHGYRKWSHSHIWVSSGLSLWGPPFRIGTNSDMAVFEIGSAIE